MAQTPYQRLLASGVLEPAQVETLARLYASLNPIQLRAEIEETLEALWKLADHSRAGKTVDEAEKELVGLA